MGYQFLVPCDALLVGQTLEHEMLRLPLQSVGQLAAQIRQESFADVEIMADVHPFVASAEAIDSRLLRCVADDVGPCEASRCKLAQSTKKPSSEQTALLELNLAEMTLECKRSFG